MSFSFTYALMSSTLRWAAKTINKDPGMTAILKNLEDSLNHAMNSIRNSVHDLHDEAVNLEEVEKSLVHEFTFCSVQMVYDMTREVPREVKFRDFLLKKAR